MRRKLRVLGIMLAVSIGIIVAVIRTQTDVFPTSVAGTQALAVPSTSSGAVVIQTTDASRLRLLDRTTAVITTLLATDPSNSVFRHVVASEKGDTIVYTEYSVREDLTQIWQLDRVTQSPRLLGISRGDRIRALQLVGSLLYYQEETTWYAMDLEQRNTVRVAAASLLIPHDLGRSVMYGSTTPDGVPVIATRLRERDATYGAEHVVVSNAWTFDIMNNQLLLLRRQDPSQGSGVVLLRATLRGEQEELITTLALGESELASPRLFHTAQGVIFIQTSERLLQIDGDELVEYPMTGNFIATDSGSVVVYQQNQSAMTFDLESGALMLLHPEFSVGIEDLALWHE